MFVSKNTGGTRLGPNVANILPLQIPPPSELTDVMRRMAEEVDAAGVDGSPLGGLEKTYIGHLNSSGDSVAHDPDAFSKCVWALLGADQIRVVGFDTVQYITPRHAGQYRPCSALVCLRPLPLGT